MAGWTSHSRESRVLGRALTFVTSASSPSGLSRRLKGSLSSAHVVHGCRKLLPPWPTFHPAVSAVPGVDVVLPPLVLPGPTAPAQHDLKLSRPARISSFSSGDGGLAR